MCTFIDYWKSVFNTSHAIAQNWSCKRFELHCMYSDMMMYVCMYVSTYSTCLKLFLGRTLTNVHVRICLGLLCVQFVCPCCVYVQSVRTYVHFCV